MSEIEHEALLKAYDQLDSKIQVFERWLREWETAGRYISTGIQQYLEGQVSIETMQTVLHEHKQFMTENKAEKMIFFDLQD